MLFDRTLHPDEANQAITTGHLLETGSYCYRPDDHHGPTLYYAAAAVQKAAGHNTTATLDGTLLRCTPLLFAVLALVLGFLAVRRLTGRVLAGGAFVLLLAASPLFVFFATDFIQEMLLAAFLVGMVFSAAEYLVGESKRLKPGTWALCFGISAGLAFATKETAIISFAAAVLSALVLKLKPKVRPNDLVLAILAFLLTAVLLFSSFCENWKGIYDAFVAAPLSYLGRAGGSSPTASWHVHPWWKYLQWLFLGHVVRDGSLHWTTSYDNLLLLAQFVFLVLPVSIFACFTRLKERFSPRLRTSFLFFALYTIFTIAIYSIIPYKTPWCTLQMLVPFVFTMAIGYALCVDMFLCLQAKQNGSAKKSSPMTLQVVVLLVIPLAMAGVNTLSLMKMWRNPDSREIPYNYAAASPEVKELAAFVAQAMEKPSAENLIAVALPPEDTWPFPWYNRKLDHCTGYWTSLEELRKLAEGGVKPSCVIVPMTEGHLVQPLFPYLKETKRYFMRPGVRVRVFR